ncbi:hypothetical protein CQA53_10390 [Helicobacter didelphidarum]|uniref:Uncharacterized protein n=1 Tax=Helicobacter didelphidarum TaxID=2040648 RepID=A0A3D8I9S5_9HELI|nr:hypothetical protein [Helicobacter didelphidarum]RDU61271.1 hypothetical protein CQA53_10390 [Helicobacter didelphidarum]
MLFVIIFFLPIVFTLSYFIWWLIYRKAFKSQKKISKFLVFIGGIGLIIFFYTPYSYNLQPSYHEFKEICKLDPEIYQSNGGKIDEEYYNKVLKYFDTDLDNMSNVRTLRISDDKKHFSYWFEKWIGDRIDFTFVLWFKDERATKDNIKKASLWVWWDQKRPIPLGNEGVGLYWGNTPINCGYFK